METKQMGGLVHLHKANNWMANKGRAYQAVGSLSKKLSDRVVTRSIGRPSFQISAPALTGEIGSSPLPGENRFHSINR